MCDNLFAKSKEVNGMSLSQQQKALIVRVDKKVKMLLANGGNDETLLVEVLELMPEVKILLDSVPTKEIELYFYEYNGFYRYLKVLEHVAQGLAAGQITVPE